MMFFLKQAAPWLGVKVRPLTGQSACWGQSVRPITRIHTFAEA